VKLDEKITLSKVLYLHKFKFNLFSVTKLLTKQNLCIHIFPAECFFF